MREITAGTALTGHRGGLLEHAVDAVADPHLLFLGLEVDVGGAAVDGLLDHPVDHLDDRGVLAADAEVDRRVLAQVVERRGGLGCAVRGSASASSSLLGRDGAVAEVGVLEALEQVLDVVGRGDRRADLVAGHDGDVVDGEDVGRVGHRDQQRAVADEGDRDGLVAADRRGRDELGGVGIDAVELEIDVVEAEALGDGAGELVVGERAVARPARARARSRSRVRAARSPGPSGAIDEAEVDEDVGQHAAGAAAPRRRGDPVAASGLWPGLS